MEVVHFFFFNDTATTEIYTLSLHDALPIYRGAKLTNYLRPKVKLECVVASTDVEKVVSVILEHARSGSRSEEHTSELQSRQYLVCRLLLEKKKKNHHSV